MTINIIRDWVRKHQVLLTTVLILSGFGLYISQSIHFAHTIPSSVWDEGSYIYKGYLFTSGKHTPFKDFGPWTNQMPVAYFLPGISQTLFGAGIRSARYFAVALGTLTLLGLVLAAKRYRGSGWVALVVWAVVLNPGWVKAFSQVFSQGMVSFFFAWTIFFLLGKQPKTWELTAASFLAALAGMTRVNVLPLAFLLVLYVFWQHGKKPGLWALAGMAAPVLFFHLFYWPEILKIWAYWIPPEVFPPITSYRSPWREVFVPSGFSWWPVSAWL
ncbi:MAG: glycosyltransferase family 39 protein, partial [Anaerolineales bacterium]